MEFLNTLLLSFLTVVKKYAVFEGRARRKELWMFALSCAIVSVVLSILAQIPFLGILFVIVSGLFGLAILVPSLAVGARRLHDTNRSAMFLLLALIPLVGSIILIVFWAQEGMPGENQYGPNPKGAA